MTDYYKFSDEIPDKQVIERLLGDHPDADQLIEIISRSYDYIQKLPLKGISENYSKEKTDLLDPVP